MKKEEIIQIRRELLKERIKNDHIRKLQGSPDVLEYLQLRDISKLKIETDKEIIERILKNYKLTSTNNIWVITGAYISKIDTCYQETYKYAKNVALDDPEAEYKEYIDIESLEFKKLLLKSKESLEIVKEFETENIVLNPTNFKKEKNCFIDVRNDFVYNAITSCEDFAKQRILKNYKRI